MLKLALPIAMQQLLVSCAQLVDTAMVTGLGNIVVSSIGVSSRLIFLMNLFYFGISSGSAAMIAQFWGAKEKKNIQKSYGIAFVRTSSQTLDVAVPLPTLNPSHTLRRATFPPGEGLRTAQQHPDKSKFDR